MLRLGSDVVAMTTGRIQQHAAAVILETARCASSVGQCASLENTAERGCTTAELGEINVLLDGLQSASVALREVCIQVSTAQAALHRLHWQHYTAPAALHCTALYQRLHCTAL